MSFSSSSSSSSTTDLVQKYKSINIVACVVGMSYINAGSGYNNDWSHAALLLINTDADISDEQRGEGILVEYGNYSPNMSKEEKKKYDKKQVLYRYGEKGGLRFYGMGFSQFIKEFCNIIYVDMDIDEVNQNTFSYFLDVCSPLNEFKWIQKNYSVINGFHCQKFVAEALEILKPNFLSRDVRQGALCNKNKKDKVDLFPSCISEVLKRFDKRRKKK